MSANMLREGGSRGTLDLSLVPPGRFTRKLDPRVEWANRYNPNYPGGSMRSFMSDGPNWFNTAITAGSWGSGVADFINCFTDGC
jgi:hypothetical protein